MIPSALATRWISRAVPLAAALALTACSSSGGASSSDGGLQSDAGACIATGMACVRGNQCVGGNCGDNCCAGRCVGGGTDDVCTAPNVDFSTNCSPSCVGGDPEGTWHLAGACGSVGDSCPLVDGGVGAVGPESTLVVSAGGGTGSAGLGESLSACSRFTLGELGGLSGSWSPEGGTVGGDSYCVQGSTLYIFPQPDPQSSSDPHLTAFKFVH